MVDKHICSSSSSFSSSPSSSSSSFPVGVDPLHADDRSRLSAAEELKAEVTTLFEVDLDHRGDSEGRLELSNL